MFLFYFRGFDIPSSFVLGSFVSNSSNKFVVYADSLTSLLPTPDFSMPFNVMTLTGVIVGFFFAGMLRATNTDYSSLKQGGTVESTRPLMRLLSYLVKKIDGS